MLHAMYYIRAQFQLSRDDHNHVIIAKQRLAAFVYNATRSVKGSLAKVKVGKDDLVGGL